MLFVPEEEEETSVSQVENDPIVESIPLFLNKPPEGYLPLLVQSKHEIPSNSTIKFKQTSQVLQVETPLETQRHFSAEQASRLGASAKVLKGVIIDNTPQPDSDSTTIRSQPGSNGGSDYYILALAKNGEAHLTPTPHTIVLNSDFQHIDQAKAERMQEHSQHFLTSQQQQQQQNGAQDGKVNVVTMSAKSTRELQPRLGGALLSSKLEGDEDSTILQISDSNDKDFLISKVVEPVEVTLTRDEYLESLLRD